MDQRISFVTLAVADLERTRAFYVDGLGWEPEVFVPGEVLMIRAGDKLILSLWSEDGFEAEVGPIRRGEGVVPITLAHNVATEAEVDEILALAASIGAEASEGAAPRLGRLHRLLRGPRRLPLGDRGQPRRDRPDRAALTDVDSTAGQAVGRTSITTSNSSRSAPEATGLARWPECASMAWPSRQAANDSSSSHCGHHEVAVLALDRAQQLEAEEARRPVDGVGAVGEALLQLLVGLLGHGDGVDLHDWHGPRLSRRH